MTKGLTKSIAMLIFSVVTLAASAVAWFTMSQSVSTGEVGVLTADFDALISFQVKKNDATDYESIDSILDMHNHFGYTLPGDVMHFKISIENKSSRSINSNLEVRNLYSAFEMVYPKYDENYTANMLDIYYIVDGLVRIEKETDDSNQVETSYTNYNNLQTDLQKTPKALFIGTDYEIHLNQFRISNLIDQSNNLLLVSNISLDVDKSYTAYFSIKYQDKDPLNDKKLYPDYTYGTFYMNSMYAFVT